MCAYIGCPVSHWNIQWSCILLGIHMHYKYRQTYRWCAHTHNTHTLFEDIFFQRLKSFLFIRPHSISSNTSLTRGLVQYIWEHRDINPLGCLHLHHSSWKITIFQYRHWRYSLCSGAWAPSLQDKQSWLAFSFHGRLVRLQVVLIGTLMSYDICELLPKGKRQMCAFSSLCNIKGMPKESSPSWPWQLWASSDDRLNHLPTPSHHSEGSTLNLFKCWVGKIT